MSPQLTDALFEAGPLALIAVGLFHRGGKPIPDSMGMDADKRERYERATKASKRSAPMFLLFSIAMFLRCWLR